MAYQNVSELPTQVLNSLDDEDARTWMESYNALNPTTDEEIIDAREKAWEACRTLPSSFSFDIIATVEDVDSDGELITLDTIKEQMDSYISKGGVVQSDHGNYNVATIWAYDDYTDPETGYPGILVHGNVFGGRGDNEEYRLAREDFRNGKNSMSIAGDASIEGYECDGQRCFTRRNLQTLMEISLCNVPANEYCRMLWYNDGAVVKSKGEGEMTLKAKDVHIHKSYDECGLMEISKAFRDLFVPSFYKALRPTAHNDGLHIIPPEGSSVLMKAVCMALDYECLQTEEGLTITKGEGSTGASSEGASNPRYSDDEGIQKKRVYIVTPDDRIYFQTLGDARGRLNDRDWVSGFSLDDDDTDVEIWGVDAWHDDDDAYPIEAYTLGQLRDRLGIERMVKSEDIPDGTRIKVETGEKGTVVHCENGSAWVRLDVPKEGITDVIIHTDILIPLIEKD